MGAAPGATGEVPDDETDPDAEDAFDPEVFNRRYHGQPTTAPKSRKPSP